jgi:hypothetical protein
MTVAIMIGISVVPHIAMMAPNTAPTAPHMITLGVKAMLNSLTPPFRNMDNGAGGAPLVA